MTPTARGIVTLVTAVVLFGLAWQTRIGWFYVVDAAVWGILAVNAVVPMATVRGLHAERRITALTQVNGAPTPGAHVFEDSPMEIAIGVTNRSWLPKLYLIVEERCPLAPPAERRTAYLIDAVLPAQGAVAAYAVRPYKRGVYAFPPLRVESTAPFGLFRAQRVLPAPLDVTVYPETHPVPGLPHGGFLQGTAAEPGPPRPSGEMRGAREYRPGDQVRSVHWRGSARKGLLMVREFDHVPEGELRVAFNPAFEAGEGRDTTLEYAVRAAASLARAAAQSGHPFRLWTGAAPAGETFPSWQAALERLAPVTPDANASGPDARHPIGALLGFSSPSGVSIAIVSAADHESLSLLERRRSGARPTVLLLEGFAPEHEDTDAAETLVRLGYRVVRCGRGSLAGAVSSLGVRSGGHARQPAAPSAGGMA